MTNDRVSPSGLYAAFVIRTGCTQFDYDKPGKSLPAPALRAFALTLGILVATVANGASPAEVDSSENKVPLDGKRFTTSLNTVYLPSPGGDALFLNIADGNLPLNFNRYSGQPLDKRWSETSDMSFGPPVGPRGGFLMAQANVEGGGENATDDAAGDTAAEAEASAAAVAEAMLNPLSYLWLMFMQNDMIWYDGTAMDAIGEGSQVQNTTLLMPVLSQQLTEDWKMIFRPVIPINSFKVVDNVNISANSPGAVTGVELGRKTGLGDIVLWTAFSKQYTAPNIFGFGFTAMLDTASDDFLGSGKNSIGPMALAFNISDKWVKGIVAQHWWSVGGDDFMNVQTDVGPVQVKRPDVNLTDLQVVLRYRKNATTNIGMAPNWRYNWDTNQWSIPLGIGFDTMVKLGPLPAKIGLEAYYYVKQDNVFGPQFQLRFMLVPVIPAPSRAREPLFGN